MSVKDFPVPLTLELDVQSDIAEQNTSGKYPNEFITSPEWQQWFTQWLEEMHPELSPIQSYALSLRLTLDKEMKHFNGTFRHIDKATDVLAFASLEREALPPEIWESQPMELGDIIISVETADRQAREQGHSIKKEVAWLASHGLLHLLGWDHPDDESLEQMLAQQSKLLALVGLH